MISALKKQIEQEFPFLKDKELLITVSGGIDSIVLAHLLHSLNYSITIAHCNFNLRGKESDNDEAFVKEFSLRHEIPFFSTSFKTEIFAKEKSISIQMAARDLRYEWFEKIRKQEKLAYVLTAHNKDDVLETILINFTRGTGLSGLTGIPAINGNIIRPLLQFSRKEISEYAQQHTVAWREDSSNKSTKYFRNKLRHDVIPILKELNPGLMDSLDNTLKHLKGSQAIIDDAIEKTDIITKENNLVRLNIDKIKELENPAPYLHELLKSYGFTEWDDVSNLINAQSGKQVFSKTYRLVKDRDYLFLSKIEKTPNAESFQVNDVSDLTNEHFEISFSKDLDSKELQSIKVDASKLVFPLTIRKWKHGDIFYPTGMTGKKKVSKYFKDEKLSLLEKEQCWILENGDHQIIWIVSKRADRRFETSESTQNKLQIRIKSNS